MVHEWAYLTWRCGGPAERAGERARRQTTMTTSLDNSDRKVCGRASDALVRPTMTARATLRSASKRHVPSARACGGRSWYYEPPLRGAPARGVSLLPGRAVDGVGTTSLAGTTRRAKRRRRGLPTSLREDCQFPT